MREETCLILNRNQISKKLFFHVSTNIIQPTVDWQAAGGRVTGTLVICLIVYLARFYLTHFFKTPRGDGCVTDALWLLEEVTERA